MKQEIVVETKNGKIIGICGEECSQFMGIPYAQAPVGKLRWKAPQPIGAWKGELRADHFPAKSMQMIREDSFYDKEFYQNEEYSVPISEDSLYLNIWMPNEKSAKCLPVAFWIHGGAFMGGFGSEMEFDGAAFCKKGVILVTINYRLNVFGFLAHPWLSEESPHSVSGNYGTLDQIMALKWVYENIEYFGGDRENITIMGQSAGAMSVQTLLSSELTGNMIKRAIMQSGGSYGEGLHRDIPLEEAEIYGEEFVAETGARSLEELRQMSAEELILATERFMGKVLSKGKGFILIPNIDGFVLKEGYYDTIDHNNLKNIPYLLGSNKNDIMTTKEDVESGKKSSLYKGCLGFAEKVEKNGNEPAYVYYFSRQLPGDDAGAFHSAEIWYMFGTLSRCWRPMTAEDYQLSERMVNYWTNFIENGNPNGEGEEEWKRCFGEERFVMEFDV